MVCPLHMESQTNHVDAKSIPLLILYSDILPWNCNEILTAFIDVMCLQCRWNYSLIIRTKWNINDYELVQWYDLYYDHLLIFPLLSVSKTNILKKQKPILHMLMSNIIKFYRQNFDIILFNQHEMPYNSHTYVLTLLWAYSSFVYICISHLLCVLTWSKFLFVVFECCGHRS